MTPAVPANDLQLLSEGRFLLGLGSQVKAHIDPPLLDALVAPGAADARVRPGDARDLAIVAARRAAGLHRRVLLAHADDPVLQPESEPVRAAPRLLAGVGDAMTEVAGEVADGFLCHGFTTERYLRDVTLPALPEGPGRRACPWTASRSAACPSS